MPPPHSTPTRRSSDLCERAGVVLAVGHNRRFWPAMRALKGMLAEGRLGRLLHIEGHNSNENSNQVTGGAALRDRKSTRLNSSHITISYDVFCLKKKIK